MSEILYGGFEGRGYDRNREMIERAGAAVSDGGNGRELNTFEGNDWMTASYSKEGSPFETYIFVGRI